MVTATNPNPEPDPPLSTNEQLVLTAHRRAVDRRDYSGAQGLTDALAAEGYQISRSVVTRVLRRLRGLGLIAPRSPNDNRPQRALVGPTSLPAPRPLPTPPSTAAPAGLLDLLRSQPEGCGLLFLCQELAQSPQQVAAEVVRLRQAGERIEDREGPEAGAEVGTEAGGPVAGWRWVEPPERPAPEGLPAQLLAYLQHQKDRMLSVPSIGDLLDVAPKYIREAAAALVEGGYNIHIDGDHLGLTRQGDSSPSHTVVECDGRLRIGVVSDTHLGSKYERLDVLDALYDWFAQEGIEQVYHAGNTLDGCTAVNVRDRHKHGLDEQVDYFVQRYPSRPGMSTFYIDGDDHESSFSKDVGISVGRYIERQARAAGRQDLVYLGFLEHDIEVRAKNGCGSFVMRVAHPGGGSAYAVSYSPQKIVECVPVSSEALTPTGWKTYEQLVPGDMVMGYNMTTGRCEWTAVDRINVGEGEIVTYRNKHFQVQCTRNHEWVMEWESRGGANPNSITPINYTRRDRYKSTIQQAKYRSRIIQSAPGPDGSGFSPVDHIDFIDRAGAVTKVLAMTSEQRRAFIYGMLIAEGTRIKTSDSIIFSQRPGQVQDAFSLACFLEGISTGISRRTTKKINGEDKICCRTTVMRKNKRIVNGKFQKEDGCVIGKVWCPTTRLGTWVMRQGDTITITGNSYSGGEKPNLLLIGHFHKIEYLYVRGVHVVQAGCTVDQSPWARKKRLSYHLGGWIIDAVQCQQTGALIGCKMEVRTFFDREFYQKRWEN